MEMNFFTFKIEGLGSLLSHSFIIVVGASTESRAKDIIKIYCDKLEGHLDYSTLEFISKQSLFLPHIIYIHEVFDVRRESKSDAE